MILFKTLLSSAVLPTFCRCAATTALSTFTNNTSWYGGAIGIWGDAEAMVLASTFIKNMAYRPYRKPYGGDGGAVLVLNRARGERVAYYAAAVACFTTLTVNKLSTCISKGDASVGSSKVCTNSGSATSGHPRRAQLPADPRTV